MLHNNRQRNLSPLIYLIACNSPIANRMPVLVIGQGTLHNVVFLNILTCKNTEPFCSTSTIVVYLQMQFDVELSCWEPKKKWNRFLNFLFLRILILWDPRRPWRTLYRITADCASNIPTITNPLFQIIR